LRPQDWQLGVNFRLPPTYDRSFASPESMIELSSSGGHWQIVSKRQSISRAAVRAYPDLQAVRSVLDFSPVFPKLPALSPRPP
jgi:hypothetical protein